MERCVQIVLYDQIGARKPIQNFVLDWTEGIPCTVRDLLAERVRCEHDKFRQPGSDDELDAFLYGPEIRHFSKLTPEEAVKAALSSFQRNAFMLFVGSKQLTDLDDIVVIEPRTEVRFIKLTPLKGG